MISRILALSLAASAVVAVGATGSAHVAHATTRPTALAVQGAKPYDFNGDGYTDLAFGHPYGKVSGHSSAGFVTVLPGSKTGPVTSKKKVFSQNTTGVPGSAESGDHFGWALTSLDVDRDGFADLVVGAPDEDTGDGVDAGAEWVLWGSPSGLIGTDAWSGGEPANDAEKPGAAHRFGAAMAEGDIDGNGYNDWIDAVPGAGFFWIEDLTPDDGLQAATARRVRPKVRGERLPSRSNGTMVTAAANPPRTFYPAIADVNGDHAGDVVMGWQEPSAADPAQRAGFDILTGGPDGTPPEKRTVYTPLTSLASGDFNGDGTDDVAAGYSGEAGGTGGHVTIYQGDSTLTMATSNTITQSTSGVPGTAVANDRFGYSISAGDLNGDGKDDLVAGVPGKTVSGQTVAGEAIALYGGSDGLTGTGAQAFSQSTSGVAGAAEKNDSFGWAVSVLDLNNDGFGELIAGTPKENGTDGAVSVLKGTKTTVAGTGSWSFGATTLGVGGLDAQTGVRIGRTG